VLLLLVPHVLVQAVLILLLAAVVRQKAFSEAAPA
jgi:hypothetical protein